MDGDGTEAVVVVVVVNIMLQLFLLWIIMFELLLLLGVSIAKKLFLLRIRLLLLYCKGDVCIKTWFTNLLVPSRDDGLSWDILQETKEEEEDDKSSEIIGGSKVQRVKRGEFRSTTLKIFLVKGRKAFGMPLDCVLSTTYTCRSLQF